MVRAEGTDTRKSLAYKQACGMVHNRTMAFTPLPIPTLDRIGLQAAVNDFGRKADEDGA